MFHPVVFLYLWSEMGIDLKIYFPEREEIEDMINSRGINLFYHSVDNRHFCCNVRKVKPLKNILRNRSVWITGIRAEQTVARKNARKVEYVKDHNVWKVNPLLDWSRDEIWSYVNIHKVPYNILFDQNYKSIGCQPCTRAVGKDDDERSGRWWWEDGVKECGLHLTEGVNTDLNLGKNSGDLLRWFQILSGSIQSCHICKYLLHSLWLLPLSSGLILQYHLLLYV